MMAQQIPKMFSRRFCQQVSPFRKLSKSMPRTFSAPISKAPARRTYASTGESGPNPTPGQNPFKIWPFVAIVLAGSGAYVLMVNQRKGTFAIAFQTFPL